MADDNQVSLIRSPQIDEAIKAGNVTVPKDVTCEPGEAVILERAPDVQDAGVVFSDRSKENRAFCI